MKVFRNWRGGAIAAAVVAASAFVGGGGASAQTATDLICNGCVDGTDIGSQAVRSANIRNNAIKTNQIRDRAVSAAKLSAGAKPAGGNFAIARDNIIVGTSDQVIRSVTLDLPAPGLVVLNSGGHMTADKSPTLLRCAIAQSESGLSIQNDVFFNIEGSATNGHRRSTIGSTRAFQEAASGPHTYQLKCNSAAGGATVTNAALTAIYVPQVYTPSADPE